MQELNYHHLFYFKVIASEGSISRAAARLQLGQPTLSMQLKQFEDDLGHQLFERKSRSLVLTETGRVVLSYANEIFQLGDEMLQTLGDRPDRHKRMRLQVGALDSVPRSLVRDLMRAAFKRGDCQISIREGPGPDLMRDLVEHKLDLVLSNASAPSLVEERLYARSLLKTPLIVAGAPKFESLRHQFPRSLSQQPFLLPTAHSRVRHELDHYLEDRALSLDVLGETQDSALLKSMAVEGQALIVIGEQSVRAQLDEGLLVKIGELENHSEEIWLIAAKRKIQNPIARDLMRDFTFRS